MFHAIGKTVNAPSKVLLARSRSRQEDAERSEVVRLALPAYNGDADRFVAPPSLGSERAPQSQIKSTGFGARSAREAYGPDLGANSSPARQNREPDESSMRGARN